MSKFEAKQIDFTDMGGARMGNHFETFAEIAAASGTISIDPSVATQYKIITSGNIVLNFVTTVMDAAPSKWASVVVEIDKGVGTHSVTITASGWSVSVATGLDISPNTTEPYALVFRAMPSALGETLRVTDGGQF